MDLFEQSWFRTAGSRMDWAAARQKVLTENIANADTPGFVGSDVVSFEDHLSRSAGLRGDVRTEEASSSWGGSFDGNQIVIEEQMMLSTEASGQFNLATSLYKKGHALLAIAASKGR